MLNFALSKMKQGEATKWLIIFADFCDSKNKARGSLGTRHLFKFLNGLLQVNCFSIAPHHRRYAAELPPEGKPLKEAVIKILNDLQQSVTKHPVGVEKFRRKRV